MPEMKLDAADAAELAEMLQFFTGWLALDPGRLGVSLAEFAGHAGALRALHVDPHCGHGVD
jgi:hypothetical protein